MLHLDLAKVYRTTPRKNEHLPGATWHPLTPGLLCRQSSDGKICRSFFTPCAFGILFTLGLTAASSAEPFEAPMQLLASTHLIELTNGSELSKVAAAYRSGSFQSSEGKIVHFDTWYSARFPDIQLALLTQMTPEFGWIWGMSTGERGEKYAIAPSVKLGFLYQAQISRVSIFSIRATSVLGGRIKEKPCTANYGDIGGVQQVNCRLAAGDLPPAETLRYLTNMLPRNRNRIAITYTNFF